MVPKQNDLFLTTFLRNSYFVNLLPHAPFYHTLQQKSGSFLYLFFSFALPICFYPFNLYKFLPFQSLWVYPSLPPGSNCWRSSYHHTRTVRVHSAYSNTSLTVGSNWIQTWRFLDQQCSKSLFLFFFRLITHTCQLCTSFK